MTYSVLTEPVIPVIMPDGTQRAVGIREAFLRAHEIADIQYPDPLARYGILRMLIAWAMDMLAPEDSRARRSLLKAGRFDPEAFDAYVAMCEKDGPCFDLYDDERPFLQSRYIEDVDKKAMKPVANIFHALPTGNNHVFLDHRNEDTHRKSPLEALGALCASYVYCTAGAQGYPSSVNNTPPVYTIVLGNDLFETIVFNMVSVKEAGNIPYGAGDVPWRKHRNIVPKTEVASVSLL